MFNKIQLITYLERLGCKNMTELTALVGNELKGLVAGIHLLPFYYPFDGEDAGFDPIDHLSVDPRLGEWLDMIELGREVQIMADLIVNHISSKSKQFKDYLKHGEKSKYANLFLSFDKVFPKGATKEELSKIYRPRPGIPFTTFKFEDGSNKSIWTTFTSNQIDIDVNSYEGRNYLEDILNRFQRVGIKMIRLDAAGYAIKKKGTSCFMIPETFEFINDLTEKARQRGIIVLVEVHSHYKTQIEIAKRVDYVYDFALPVLVLDTIFNQDGSNLRKWLKISPRNAFTVLDTHDGIGIVDVAKEGNKAGLIESSRLDNIVEQIHINTKHQSKKATGIAASNLDLYQVNCTYYDALGRNDMYYLLARAIQFFVPGIPQVYYVGLLAGENDMELLAKTNIGRDINRHYYTKEELNVALQKPVVKRLKELILFRNTYPAFNGEFVLHSTEPHILKISWENHKYVATLFSDLKTGQFEISYSDLSGKIIKKSF
ncbi:MAG: sucrose phosphorylase [Bacteroidales bacterium]|nr:sucrose phosphorylase [Bacteroidales bacterium]